MSERERAKRARDVVLSALFHGDENPSFCLAAITLENMTSLSDVFLMEDYGFIKYMGKHNGLDCYKVR